MAAAEINNQLIISWGKTEKIYSIGVFLNANKK